MPGDQNADRAVERKRWFDERRGCLRHPGLLDADARGARGKNRRAQDRPDEHRHPAAVGCQRARLRQHLGSRAITRRPTTGRKSRRRIILQPRLEAEVAFLIGRPLQGPYITAQEVLAATDALALVVEIVASRIADWRIKLVDTIADNASYGGFVLGQWDSALRYADLRLLGVNNFKNGEAGGGRRRRGGHGPPGGLGGLAGQ